MTKKNVNDIELFIHEHANETNKHYIKKIQKIKTLLLNTRALLPQNIAKFG